MATILLTHPPEALQNYYGDHALAALRELAGVRLNPLGREMSTDELIVASKGCEIIVSFRTSAAPPRLFEALPDLVAFSRCAIDIRNIDVAAASRAGVLVTQASAGFVTSVTEWIIGVMIDLARSISAATLAYRDGRIPASSMGRELRGATLGIIGYGRIARELSRLALALGMQVRVFDPYVNVSDHMPIGDRRDLRDDDSPGGANPPPLTQVDWATVLNEADFLVCLATATDETENLIDAQAFAAMKQGAFFINPSRGNLVDEVALGEALDSGRIDGCALDVGRAPDQMPTPTLAAHPKVIATPHIGGLTPQAIAHQADETVGQVAQILSGRIPFGAVNAAQARRLLTRRPDAFE